MSDEGLHEIQLNGKQLVFLFMTATVVAVVIFLCGVMVGRGVPTQRPATVIATEGADPTTTDESRAAQADTAVAPPPAGSPNSPTKKPDLQYSQRLEQPDPVVEDLNPAPVKEPFKPAVATAPPPPRVEKTEKADRADRALKAGNIAKEKARSTPAANKPAAAESVKETKPDEAPGGSGFVVQVAAVRQRAEADTIRGRLARKGYPAFVTTAGAPGAPTYRVRVGKYSSKREADTVAAKLEREEQFKPWVTR